MIVLKQSAVQPASCNCEEAARRIANEAADLRSSEMTARPVLRSCLGRQDAPSQFTSLVVLEQARWKELGARGLLCFVGVCKENYLTDVVFCTPV